MSELPKAEHELHHHTIDSDIMQSLRKSPQPANHFSYFPEGGGVRDLIRKINQPITTSSGSKKYGFGRWQMVYYLYGDERRAIRVTIEENERYIKEAFESNAHPFRNNWGEGMFGILCEEWSIHRRLKDE